MMELHSKSLVMMASQHTNYSLPAAISTLSQPPNSIESLKHLEKLRIGIELFCYLLFENFHPTTYQLLQKQNQSYLLIATNDEYFINAYTLHCLRTEPKALDELFEVSKLICSILVTQSDFVYRYSSGLVR